MWWGSTASCLEVIGGANSTYIANSTYMDTNEQRLAASLQHFFQVADDVPQQHTSAHAPEVVAYACWRMLTYADACRRRLRSQCAIWRCIRCCCDVCWRMLTHADVC